MRYIYYTHTFCSTLSRPSYLLIFKSKSMKKSKFTGLLFCAAMVFFLTSCGGEGSKKETSTDSTATTTVDSSTKAVKPEVNTIVTTPQSMMVAVHKVSDFAKWKGSYDGHDSMRLA